MKPLWNNVLVRIKKSETKVGGIVIPGQENTKTAKCEVVAVGEQVTSLSAGNIAFFRKEDGFPVEIEGETLFVFPDSSALGICS